MQDDIPKNVMCSRIEFIERSFFLSHKSWGVSEDSYRQSGEMNFEFVLYEKDVFF